MGIIGSGGQKMGGGMTPMKSNKGCGDGQFFHGFPQNVE
jgi:hypothetical protein